MINYKKFYSSYRKQFGRIRKEKTVDTIDAIIDTINRNWDDDYIQERKLEKLAYMFATVRHEVGADMLPIVENMNYTSASRIVQVWPTRFNMRTARDFVRKPAHLGNTVYSNRLGNGDYSSGDGYRYRGRGIGCQLTGKVNYKKFSSMAGEDLVKHPYKAMDVKIGSRILFFGTTRGMFTGRSLSHYIDNKKVDFRNARRVVNADVGLNGNKIARIARKFLTVLQQSVEEGANHIQEDKVIIDNEKSEIHYKTKEQQQIERKLEVIDDRSTVEIIADGVKRIIKRLYGNKTK